MTDICTLSSGSSCRICASETAERMAATILGKYAATYDQCTRCGYLSVRDPHWIEEAYARAICRTDTGIVARNLAIAERLAPLLSLIGGDGPYLDYGGGIGLLTRLMRDRGFNYLWFDPYARNELAEGFEHGPDCAPCIAVSAFEVLEHVEDPAGFAAAALAKGRSDTLIFSTVLFDGAMPPADWDYFARDEGQHIGFHTRRSLAAIGERLGLRLYSRGVIHMLTRRRIGNLGFRASLGPAGRLLARFPPWRRPSLTQADQARLRSENAAARG